MATPNPMTVHCKVCGRVEIVEDLGDLDLNEKNTCYFCPDCSGKGHEVWACRLCCRKDPKDPCPLEVQEAITKTTVEPLCHFAQPRINRKPEYATAPERLRDSGRRGLEDIR